MNRQYRRRVEREWNKIKLDKICTKFVERNGLFAIPYVIFFQAVKICDDIMCAYSLGVFEFKQDFGFLECVTACQFVNGLFRSLGSVEVGIISEEELEEGEENPLMDVGVSVHRHFLD